MKMAWSASMKVRVRVSLLLRKYTDGREVIEVGGSTPLECLRALEARFPAIKRRLYDKWGDLLPQLQLFINGERVLPGELNNFPLQDGDELLVLVAVGGG